MPPLRTLALALALTLPASVLTGAAAASGGGRIFAQAGCGNCHTLAAAGAAGSGGPNLDQLRPSAAAVRAQVTYGGGGMPAFEGSLSSSEIASLAAFVSSAAGGGSAGVPAAAAGLPPGEVRRIQRKLARLGFFHHAVTGVYGPVTTHAVAAFQRSAGLTADGLWGPRTAAAAARR